jgi:hypothetical protein
MAGPLGLEEDISMFAGSIRDNGSPPGNDAAPPPTGDEFGIVRALKGASAPLSRSTPRSDDDVALAQAYRTIQFIRCSKEFFPAMRDLADHPGWEMVLHVFIAGREGRTITTADLCELTGTWRPLTIRYIEMLFERGLIDRDVSATKPDAWPLSLTPSTEARLQELLCNFWRSIRNEPEAGEAN